MAYQLPVTSGYRKILTFSYKQNRLGGGTGPRCSLRGLLIDRNTRPPQPTPHLTPWHERLSDFGGWLRGLYNRFSFVPQPFLAVSEPQKCFGGSLWPESSRGCSIAYAHASRNREGIRCGLARACAGKDGQRFNTDHTTAHERELSLELPLGGARAAFC